MSVLVVVVVVITRQHEPEVIGCDCRCNIEKALLSIPSFGRLYVAYDLRVSVELLDLYSTVLKLRLSASRACLATLLGDLRQTDR